jgi:hypothetical protein
MPKFAMADGRAFTDFNPSCTLNATLQEKYNLPDTHAYRHFLQHNAEQVMKDLADCNPQQECKTCPVCKLALDRE